MFSTPETSVHVRDKNRGISPLERERERKVTGKGSGEKVSFKTRMDVSSGMGDCLRAGKLSHYVTSHPGQGDFFRDR